MPLRLTPSPLQRDIVTMLEEAGADSRYSQRNAETFRSVRVRLRDCQTGEPACVLGPSVEFCTDATPLALRAALPRSVAVAVSKKATVPVGVPSPNCLATKAE
jgi:hypothetical protein